MEEASENGKESFHSAHPKGMNEWIFNMLLFQLAVDWNPLIVI